MPEKKDVRCPWTSLWGAFAADDVSMATAGHVGVLRCNLLAWNLLDHVVDRARSRAEIV